MCSMIVEEKYDCNAATIYGNANADTIMKKKKRFWTLDCISKRYFVLYEK